MKRTPFAAQFLSLLALSVSISSFGQDNLVASNKGLHPITEPVTSYTSIPAPKVISASVEQGFVKQYPQATDAKWIQLEKGFRASFLNNGQKNNGHF